MYPVHVRDRFGPKVPIIYIWVPLYVSATPSYKWIPPDSTKMQVWSTIRLIFSTLQNFYGILFTAQPLESNLECLYHMWVPLRWLADFSHLTIYIHEKRRSSLWKVGPVSVFIFGNLNLAHGLGPLYILVYGRSQCLLCLILFLISMGLGKAWLNNWFWF